MAKIKGGIIWQGKSLINGESIVVVATTNSANSKTGAMVQTWIICSDIDPITASRTGADTAICGNCPHKGEANPAKAKGWADNRACYVNLLHGPGAVYKAFKVGKYPVLSQEQMQALGQGKLVRLGSYGDPAAVPPETFDSLLSGALGHTGYTHQAGAMKTDQRLMVSADNLEQALVAWKKKRRTFRVIPVKDWKEKGKEALAKNEIICPASAEAGQRVQCAQCLLCDGTKMGKSVAIVAHGTGKKHAK